MKNRYSFSSLSPDNRRSLAVEACERVRMLPDQNQFGSSCSRDDGRLMKPTTARAPGGGGKRAAADAALHGGANAIVIRKPERKFSGLILPLPKPRDILLTR